MSSVGGIFLLPSASGFDPMYLSGIGIGLFASIWYGSMYICTYVCLYGACMYVCMYVSGIGIGLFASIW